MKRIAIWILSFAIIAVFDWLFVAALVANGAELPLSSQTAEIPQVYASPTPARGETSSPVLEIPLPETFVGCWSGDVDGADYVPPQDFRAAGLSPEHYKFCFTRIGFDQWKMSFADARFDLTQLRAKYPDLQLSTSFTLEGFDDPTARVLFHAVVDAGGVSRSCDEHFILNHQDDGTLDVQGNFNCTGTEPRFFETAFSKADAGGDADGNGNVDGAPAR